MDSVSLDGWLSEIHDLILSSENRAGRSSRARRPSFDSRHTGDGSSNRVLMLGRLRELALYRAEVLHHHGFQVIAPADESEALIAIRQGNFDIAVVSYTLSDQSVREYVDLIRQTCPACPVLAIAQSTHYDRLIQPDSVVLGDKGPAGLVAALRRLLQER